MICKPTILRVLKISLIALMAFFPFSLFSFCSRDSSDFWGAILTISGLPPFGRQQFRNWKTISIHFLGKFAWLMYKSCPYIFLSKHFDFLIKHLNYIFLIKHAMIILLFPLIISENNKIFVVFFLMMKVEFSKCLIKKIYEHDL